MSFAEEYNKLRKERIEQQEKEQRRASGQMSFAEEYLELREQRERQQATKNRKKSNFLDSVKTLTPEIKPEDKKEETTAPVADNKRTWFKKGSLFEDGYQVGDVTKTILGTATDLIENAAAGVAGMGESLVDTFATIAPYFAQGQYYQNGGAYRPLQEQQQFETSIAQTKQGVSEFVKKDLYDEKKLAEKIVAGTDKNSVLGEKSEGLAQSGGQLLATAGLAAAGVPGSLVIGTTSFGSQTEQALNEDATLEEAAASGLISAAAEILTEKISSAINFDGKALDEALLDRITKNISNKLVKAAVNVGVGSAGEGLEEVVSQIATNLGTKLYKEENLKEILTSKQARDEYVESFIGGAVLGGIGGTIGEIKGKNKLTETEQKVVDAEFEKRTEGKDLSKKEQNKIYEDILDDMAKGRISTDAIEEVLGGESYEAYKEALSKEEDAIKELSELYKGDELLQQIEDFKKSSESNQLKSQLGESVYGLVKDSRLAESYNEKNRRREAFQADVSKYDEKQKAIVQKAIDSGVLNNTNKTHEFVDLIAKIASDKDMTFDFVNNAKLKESGFAIDGKTVNGFVTKDGISINIDSAKSLDTVIGHEITHVLEGTELYNELEKVLFDYAKSKKAKGDFANEYMERLYNTRQLYKDIDGYKGVEGFKRIKNEVAADLVGDYIFTDTDFVRRLSVENRNVFQKIFDEIKYLCKVATAGSKEARQLEQVQRAFEKAYKEKSTAEVSGTKYSLNEFEDGRRFVDVQADQALFDGLDDKAKTKLAIDIIKKRFAGKVVGVDNPVFVNGRGATEYGHPVKNISSEIRDAKMRASTELDNLIDAGTNFRTKPDGEDGHLHPNATGDFEYFDAIFKVGDEYYEGVVNVENVAKGRLFKDITKIKNITQDISSSYGQNPKSTFLRDTSMSYITQDDESVKRSLSDTDNKYVGKFLASDLRLEAPAEVAQSEVAPTKETQTKAGSNLAAKPTKSEKAQIAKILSTEPTKANRRNRNWAIAKAALLDKGAVFEDLSFKTKNRKLMEKWNYILTSEGRAQYLIGNGDKGVKSLVEILDNVQDNEKSFAEYLYHKHNIDRMTLEERFEGATNKAVFGDAVTAAESREIVRRSEKNNPEFKKYAEDVYKYNRHLRQLLVDGGVISQKTADLWEKMYPHYVPISRVMENGVSVYVPLDSRRTGVNAPVKKAKGGNQDIRPVYTVMAGRTLQTFKAIAKNNFGVELKNTLESQIANDTASVDDVLNSLSDEEALLQKAKNGKNPTFTVFENGERVTFEVSEDMYDALKPVSEKLAMTFKLPNAISKWQRGVLTEYNPMFMLTNAIKDAQDVLINSQHPLKTYAKMPEAFKQIANKGYWYEEYMKSGGEDNTYFNKQTGEFEAEKKGAAKILESFPFNLVSTINNVIERIPRLAEYIASREEGKSVEGAMLDAARVTTNFAAGGDVTKFLNRNGATFLNASVQGAMQQARNVREANANGLKGWVGLAARFAAAGLPALILNNILWEDDEEYEELSDYVKQNYYVVYKTDDGRFVRIPKGRTLAVIQNAFEQVANAATGDDEADLAEFLKLAVENLAPNNPMDNNVTSPITQVLRNKTWYGEDLVPTRLQELPAAEQYDESTDSLSKWLGEKLNISPYKINYLIDQYSGAIGDVFLPMMTPEAESGDDSRVKQLIAPLRDKFTTDAVLNNQNVSDFYDKVEELTTNAKASAATDEDILKDKYMNSVNSEVSKLYKQKREIQNSNMADSAKYKKVKDIQNQINSVMRDALDTYDNIRYENGKEFAIIGDTYFQWYKPENKPYEWRKLSDDQVLKHKVTYAAGDTVYATNGEVHYRLEEGGDWRNMSDWTKISDKDLARQKEVTKELGITPEEYWGSTEVSFIPQKKGEYEYAYENPEKYSVAKAVGGYDSYKGYSSDLYNLKADKDKNGKSISGSRKKKVVEYINNLNIDYGMKLILYKSEYTSDDQYNYKIVEYLNNRDDLKYDDVKNILLELDFKVDDKGNISW